MSVGVRGSFLDNSDIEELVNKHVHTVEVMSSSCLKYFRNKKKDLYSAIFWLYNQQSIRKCKNIFVLKNLRKPSKRLFLSLYVFLPKTLFCTK